MWLTKVHSAHSRSLPILKQKQNGGELWVLQLLGAKSNSTQLNSTHKELRKSCGSELGMQPNQGQVVQTIKVFHPDQTQLLNWAPEPSAWSSSLRWPPLTTGAWTSTCLMLQNVEKGKIYIYIFHQQLPAHSPRSSCEFRHPRELLTVSPMEADPAQEKRRRKGKKRRLLFLTSHLHQKLLNLQQFQHASPKGKGW